MTVELSSLQEGEPFEGALVRLHGAPKIMGEKLMFLNFRQEPPIKYDGCIVDNPTLVEQVRTKLRKNETRLWIVSGVLREQHNVDITSLGIAEKPKETRVCKYHHATTDSHATKHVLLQDPRLLRFILEDFAPLEDLQTSVMPVHPLWCKVGFQIFQQASYRLVRNVDVESVFYDLFQSARHGFNYFVGRPFELQAEFVEVMLAGVHICDLALRQGCARDLTNVFVSQKARSALRSLEPIRVRQATAGGSRAHITVYDEKQLRFVRAACLQLSKLVWSHQNNEANNHRRFINAIGYALHNNPRLPVWREAIAAFVPLHKEGLLCDELKTAGEDIFEVGWYWQTGGRLL